MKSGDNGIQVEKCLATRVLSSCTNITNSRDTHCSLWCVWRTGGGPGGGGAVSLGKFSRTYIVYIEWFCLVNEALSDAWNRYEKL